MTNNWFSSHRVLQSSLVESVQSKGMFGSKHLDIDAIRHSAIELPAIPEVATAVPREYLD